MSNRIKLKKPHTITIIIAIFAILYLLKVYVSLKPGLEIFAKPNDELIVEGEKHFKNIRQLTFSGEKAEAYFSSEGKYFVFCSKRNNAKEGDTNIFIVSGLTEV